MTSSRLEALRSTSIIGGATAITLMVRMVRTKVLAVLLGPAGIGLEAVFDSVLTLVRTLFDLGISTAGVRQIAAASASGDPRRVAITVLTLRRVCLVLGILGAAALFLAREPVSSAAFGDASRAGAIGWLAVILLLGAVAGGQAALLQGMRRIGDLARMNIIGTVAGAILSIPIVLVWGQDGIPAYMILGAAVGLVVSWYYVRRIEVEPVDLPLSAVVREARGLVTLGFAFMVSALIAAGTTFLLRAIVIHEYGVEGAGQFQAASALSLVYIGFILQAMGTDFYPRLTAVAEEDERCNRIVNEQAEISLLLALPGILATLALAPWVIRIFYSKSFTVSADILAWQMGGMLLRIVSWPLGFMVVAKGRGGVFVTTDLAAFSVYLALAWVGLGWFGLPGAGMAFLGMYAFHAVMMYAVVRRLSGFRWTPQYLRYAAIGLAAGLLVLWMRLRWSEPWATLVPCLFAAVAALHSLRSLTRIVGNDRVQRLFSRLRLSWVLQKFRKSDGGVSVGVESSPGSTCKRDPLV
ncbi:MAG TPA: O-antigen translocase [Tardiphaga sp.]